MRYTVLGAYNECPRIRGRGSGKQEGCCWDIAEPRTQRWTLRSLHGHSQIRVLLTIILINPILRGEKSVESSARTGPCDLHQWRRSKMTEGALSENLSGPRGPRSQ